MDKIAVGIGGILAVLFVIWFFFGKREKVEQARESGNIQEIKILVNGGYSPNVIEVKKDIPVRLKFYRKDPSSCLEEVVLGDFNIRRRLDLNTETEIEFTPTDKGEFDFSCGMGMFHGRIIVK